MLKIKLRKKYRLVSGEPVRIICTNRNAKFPVVGLIQDADGTERINSWLPNGKIFQDGSSSFDLVETYE